MIGLSETRIKRISFGSECVSVFKNKIVLLLMLHHLEQSTLKKTQQRRSGGFLILTYAP